MLYDQILTLQKLIEFDSEKTISVEDQFTKQQQQNRNDIYKLIDSKKFASGKVVLISCQKNTKKFKGDGSDEYRGTDIRGVSKNGRYNW
jgi:hypothetical protein